MAETNRAPRIVVEPPIPLTTEFDSVPYVRSILMQLDAGRFRMPALLYERMLWNPRLRTLVETRLAGFISTEVRFKPIRDNRDARRAAREFAEDWPAIAPAPARKQFRKWDLGLGISFAQRALETSPSSRRQIFRIRPYWPGFVAFYWAYGTYRIQTYNRGVIDVRSPGLQDVGMPVPAPVPDPDSDPGEWVVSEPFGSNSWREGLIHAMWRPWLGHDWAMRDQARASEKNGVGIIKAMYPRGRGPEHDSAVDDFVDHVAEMGSEGVIPLEQRDSDDLPAGGMGGVASSKSFDVQPFEFSGVGIDAIDRTLTNCAIALATLILGHNLTTEVKSGGSYAAAGVGDFIRDDKKHEDAASEWAAFGPQLARPYCELNYGDPDLAPVAEYVTDAVKFNQARAQSLLAMAQAIQFLRGNVPRFDVDAYCEANGIPLLPVGQLQVPLPVPPVEPSPPKPTEEPAG